jgi:AraC-like DNA-binding protein
MIYFTRASALAGFHSFASSQGLQPANLLREAELPGNVLDNPEGLIPYQRYGRLLELAAEQSGNPTFGLQFGLHQGVGVFGSLLYLVRNASNVGAALAELSLYFHVHNNVADVFIQRQDERALLCYNSLSADLPGLRQVSELALGVGHQLMRTLLGSRWQPEAVLFQHAPQASTSHYRRLLGVAPRFNSPHCAWMFSATLLDTPLSDADAELHRLMQQHLSSLGRLQSGELPDYVQRLLRNFLPSGRVTIDYVADFMQLSSRSLQRHLAEAGTSFQQLLDQTRQSMTVHYLKESGINLGQLSELLGYSDQSAFSRAFQRWYGMSPSQWNKLNNPRPAARGLT